MFKPKPGTTFIFALVASLILVSCSSPEQRVAKYTKEGDAYLAEGDHLKATIQYRNALEIDEEHIPAIKGIVQIAENDRDYQSMFGWLQRLIRLDPQNVDALIDIGNIYLLASDEPEAQARADEALAIAPDNQYARALKASVLFKLGDKTTAITMAKDILAKNPANQDALTIIVAEKAGRNDLDGALADLNAGLQNDPNHILLQLMRIEILSKQGNQNGVDEAFKTIISQNPDDPSFRQTYAQALIQSRRFELARELLAQVVELAPDTLDNHINLIRMDNHLGGPSKARDTFTKASEARPDDIDLQFAYADFLVKNEDFDSAEAIYKKYAGTKKDETLKNRGKVELAGLYLVTDRKAQAEQLITEVIEEDAGNTGALIKRSGVKLNEQNWDAAIVDLRNALNNDPENVNALVLLSTAFEQKGDIEFAGLQLTRAFEIADRLPKIANTYARFLIRHQQNERAETILLDSLSKYSDNIEGLQLLAAARLANQDWQGAQEVARLMEAQTNSDNPGVQRILGTASVGLRNYDTAIEQLSAANDTQPLGSRPLATLISAYLEQDRADEAVTLLNRMTANDPENYDLYILQSRVAFEQNRRDDGESILNQAIALAPERIDAYNLLYRYYLRTNRRPEAFALIYEGLNKFPENYGLKFFEADILIVEKRWEEAIIVFETLYKRRPTDQLVANNYASLLTDTRQDEESRRLAVKIAETIRDNDNAYFQDTLAWAYFKVGQSQDARVILERTVKDFPNIAVLHYHLGAVYLSLEDKEKAKQYLEQSLELGGPDFIHANRAKFLLKQV